MGNHMDKVMEGLYVGGYMGAKEREKLKENKITHILAVHDNAAPEFPDDFMYKCLNISDNSSSNMTVYFTECVDFIHDSRLKGGGVFVHCAAGISRSITITTLYVMCVSSLGMEESLTVVKFCRDIANPNTGFRMQLKKFANEKLDEERQRLLDKFPESHKLKEDDEKHLQDTLKKAQEKWERLKNKKRTADLADPADKKRTADLADPADKKRTADLADPADKKRTADLADPADKK